MIDQKQLETVEYSTCLESMMRDIDVKLNPGLPWQMQHSTGRILFSPANLTEI
jgi:hypothetical protein